MEIAWTSLAVLAFLWLGYPVLIAVIAGLKPRQRKAWSGELPAVSVVIAARAARADVALRVADIFRTSYPPERLEVVVALDATLDEGQARDVMAALADAERLRVVRGCAPGGKALTLNSGVESATGEILVFADVAQRFEPDAIRRLVDALGDARTGAVSGRLELDAGGPASLTDLYWKMERRLRRDEARVHSSVGVTGAIYAMRRALFEPFPAGLILDDLYAPMRLVLSGHRVDYVDDAIARDPRRFAHGGERRRKVRTLTGVWQLCRWMPALLVPWRNPVWLQFVTHKLLRFLSPLLLTLFVAGVVAHALRTDRLWLPGSVIAGVVAVASVPATRRLLAEFVQLHVAIVQAVVNGLRGQWDVW